jgi:stage V sporulation protein D (sporulation-specific penicillin-binding protein)
MVKSDSQLRINIFLGIVVACFGLIGYRLFVLSYVKHPLYARTAEAQIEHVSNVLTRGNIFFQNKDGTTTVAATNKKFPSLTLTASKIDKSQVYEVTQGLSQITGITEATIAKSIAAGDDTSRIIARRLSTEQVEKINTLKLKGVGVIYEMDRYYPDSLAADVLGFLGYEGNSRAGQYGIEASFNNELFGKKVEGSDDNLSLAARLFSRSSKADVSPRPNDIVLTIDPVVQSFIEEQLAALLKKWSASAGGIIIQDPMTGKIIAMADKPTFDPNAYSEAEPSFFLNSNVQEIFEPGSSFKPFTMAAGLDLGKITPQTTFTDTGSVEINGYKIKNFSESIFGTVNMSQVLEKSINTGTMFVENKVGDDNFVNYVVNMGFGQRTGIELPGEVNGDISNLYSGRKVNFLTASFGQGIAVTPLQLVNAYSTIANGGKLMRPYIVEKIIHEDGGEVKTKPEILGIPITEKTADKLKTMLVSVVNNGFDKARIKGYDIAGKTGTAQLADGHGAYLEDQYIHSFAGFAPASNPKFVILIKMDKPQGVTFAADSISPTFKDIAAYLLQYYSIPPTR